MILSDIDVHREQTGGTARYFGINDSATLADHLSYVSQNAVPLTVRNLLPDLDQRAASFADDFASAIQRARTCSE